MKHLFNKCVKLYLKYRYKRIEEMLQNPFGVQKKIFASLIERGSKTEYGRKYGIDSKMSFDHFQSAVPLTDYEDLKPYISRMMEGEKSILWPGQVNWFAKSSGTTSDRSKYLPVTDDVLYKNNVASSWDTMAIVYHNDPDAKIFHKKNLVMGGSLSIWDSNKNVQVGDVSAILLHRMPAVGRPFYTPDFETALLEDWEEKITLMSEKCVKEDVVMFGGVPTWSIVLFKRILANTGKENMLEVWPGARYYVHGGVGFDPYIEQFQAFFPSPDFKYYEVYNASEGYFSIQDRADETGMLLLLNNDIFYEFVTMEELLNEKPKAIPLEAVEKHKNYAIVITTSAGLWRYLPGDTVTFTSIKPYRIKVSGRTKHFINVFGEEVMVGNTDKALAETIKTFPAKVADYTVAPIFMNTSAKGGHLWFVEFEKMPDDLKAFEILLDDNMKKINSDYAAKRHKDMALSCLQLKALPSGTFHKWLAKKGKVGGQNKVPRLYNTRKYVDELLEIINAENNDLPQ